MDHTEFHPRPEEKLATTEYDSMRRGHLFKLALQRGLITVATPLPKKPELVQMLQNNVKADALLEGQLKSLNVSTLDKETREKLKVQLEQADLADADADADAGADGDENTSRDPLADPFATNEDKFAFVSAVGNVMQLTKMYRETFPEAEPLDPKVKKKEVLALFKEAWALD